MDYKFIADLLEDVKAPNEGILSRVLQKDEHVNITLFGFSPGAGTVNTLNAHPSSALFPEWRSGRHARRRCTSGPSRLICVYASPAISRDRGKESDHQWDRNDQDSVESMMNILDHVSIRLPCNQCGQTYEVPLSDVLLSHAVVRCGCPVPQETECPPVFQIRLFDLEPIRALSLAWEQLAKRADLDGGELVFSAAEYRPTENDIAGTAREQLMIQHAEHTKEGRIRQPVPTSGTILSFDLAAEVRRLQSEQPWQAEHTANTIVKFPDFRIVLVALKAGGRLHEHRTAGRLSIQSLSGEIHVHAQGQVIEMHGGSLLSLDHEVSHDVEAKTDSVFLLTIAWPK